MNSNEHMFIIKVNFEKKIMIDHTIETLQFRMLTPGSLNSNSTLFGGEILKWMDEIAFISASRYTKQRMFTVKSDRTRFLKKVYTDSFVELVAVVAEVKRFKLIVKVDVYAEKILKPERERVAESFFELVALDIDDKISPIEILKRELL